MRTTFNNISYCENLEPNSNIEYIYNPDMIWGRNPFKEISVKQYIIVENVRQIDDWNYSFNIKGEKEIYVCSGWAFVENTERNIELLEQIKKENILIENQKQKIKTLYNSLN